MKNISLKNTILDVPSWANYFALDINGSAWIYEELPLRADTYWYNDSLEGNGAMIDEFYTKPMSDTEYKSQELFRIIK